MVEHTKIINLSSKKLTLQEEVLRFDLNHHILPRKLNLAFLKTIQNGYFQILKEN